MIRIPVVPAAREEANALVATVPPPPIMPFVVVISEGRVPLTFPVLGAVNAIVIVEPHALDIRVGLKRKVVVFGFCLRLVLVLVGLPVG